MTRSYKIFTTTTTTTSPAAYVVIQRKGRITGVSLSQQLTAGAGGASTFTTELSQVATSNVAVNDATGVIDEIQTTTQAASVPANSHHFLGGLNIPVEQADRINLNTYAGSNVSAVAVQAVVFVEE